MKALVYTGVETLELRDMPDPVPGDGEVLVRVEAVGICGSDMHARAAGDSRCGLLTTQICRRPRRLRPQRLEHGGPVVLPKPSARVTRETA